MANTKVAFPELMRAIEVVYKLRDPVNGCPWDLKQTHHSLLKYLIEESYEFISAAEDSDFLHMEEELGDVLLQILLHCKIGEENKTLSLEGASKQLADKLIRRHPHVFGDDKDNKNVNLTSDDVLAKWKDIKKEEKNEINPDNTFISKIDKAYLNFPALFSAEKIGKKTNEIKFDWKNYQEVLAVAESEWSEFKDELKNISNNDLETQKKLMEEEFGDLLFSMAQLGRHLKINSEEALRAANRKFIRRFQKMEELIFNNKKNIDSMDQMEMDQYWNEVKKLEKLKA